MPSSWATGSCCSSARFTHRRKPAGTRRLESTPRRCGTRSLVSSAASHAASTSRSVSRPLASSTWPPIRASTRTSLRTIPRLSRGLQLASHNCKRRRCRQSQLKGASQSSSMVCGGRATRLRILLVEEGRSNYVNRFGAQNLEASPLPEMGRVGKSIFHLTQDERVSLVPDPSAIARRRGMLTSERLMHSRINHDFVQRNGFIFICKYRLYCTVFSCCNIHQEISLCS
mmetsp:Transcript_44666/g.104317  ORF Transcript_44666/g.104317 Transcript_44666/m.104317 type:complete len:228 (-) Transcript_44666:12-695(-)